MGNSERETIRALADILGGDAARRVARVGIGDDAALLRTLSGTLAWTVDTSVQGVHFQRSWLSLPDLGAKSLHAAVSDLAAMGARPVAALSSIILPSDLSPRALRGIATGQQRAAVALRCPIVGGNLARGSELSITTTALGRVDRRALTRSGARPGDEVWLVGEVGLATAGLRWLARHGDEMPRGDEGRRALRACISAWRRPRALVGEGRRLLGRARAAIDVSDGLGGDATHLADESGVLLVLEEEALARVLRPELRAVALLLGEPALKLALTGGEDYALLAAGPRRARCRGARRIGRIERGSGGFLEGRDGGRKKLGRGFEHF